MNLQNIPIKTAEGRKIREAFIGGVYPPSTLFSTLFLGGVPLSGENLIINADYSQIELRILAHYSQDPTMMQAFVEGRDLHIETAAALTGIPYERFIEAKEKKERGETLNDEDIYCLKKRDHAKSVNFGHCIH